MKKEDNTSFDIKGYYDENNDISFGVTEEQKSIQSRLDKIKSLFAKNKEHKTLCSKDVYKSLYGKKFNEIIKHSVSIDSKQIKIKGYVTRDKNNNIYFNVCPPHKNQDTETWWERISEYGDPYNPLFAHLRLPCSREDFPNVKWTDLEPKKAEITISVDI